MRLRKLIGMQDARFDPPRGYDIYRDAEWDEYRVRFYINGKHQKDADYHTTDKQDAYDTAAAYLRGARS